MFKDFYEELNTLNEEMLNEGNYTYIKSFLNYAKQGLVSYKDFYYAYYKDIDANYLNSLFDENHKLVNKGTYGEIKKYNEKHPDSDFGKNLLKLWVLQFKDNAEDASEFNRKKWEEEKRKAEEEWKKREETCQIIVDYLIKHEDEIKSQCLEAVKIAIKNKDLIQLAELAELFNGDDRISYDLTDLSKWIYERKMRQGAGANNEYWCIHFYFGSKTGIIDFRAFKKNNPARSESKYAEFLEQELKVGGRGYELDHLQEFKDLVDNKKLKDKILEAITEFVNDCLPFYINLKEETEARLKAEKEKEEARLKLVNLLKKSGSELNIHQLDKINDILKKLITKWKNHINSEARIWAGSTDGSDMAAIEDAEHEAYLELSLIFKEFHWAAFDNNKLLTEFNPSKDNEEALEKAIYKILHSGNYYFRFLKD